MTHPHARRLAWSTLLACVLLVLGLSDVSAAQTTTEPAPTTQPAEPPPESEPVGEGTETTVPAEGTEEEPAEDTGVRGVLIADGEPVEGVTVAVADEAGAPVAEVESDAEGEWFVATPGAGQFTVTLDAATLPDGITLRDPDRNPLTVAVQGGRARAALFGLQDANASGDGSASGGSGASPGSPSFTRRFGARFIDGIVSGLILAVAAIGLSLIYGTTKLTNFAHGEMVAFGAILAWTLSSEGPRWPVILAGAVAIIGGAGLGASMELGLWRQLRARRTGQFQILVVSIGLSLAIRQALLIWFGTGEKRFRQYGIQRDSWELGPFRITARDLAISIICIVVLVAVALLLQRTKIGKALRAVSDNPDLAASSGINVRRVILFVWVLAGALAAGGGVLQGVFTRVDYFMGFQLLLLMFAAVILGGLGTAYGAMVGGLIVGLTTELSTLWVSPELKRVAALLVLILVLLVRPQGLLGSKERVG